MRVGARLEREATAAPRSARAAEAETITLSIDSGHVRAVRSYQVRTFEVFVAQVSNDDGKQIVFSSVPVEADRQTQQLRGVLHGLGGTPCTAVTILSDGADGPRSLGEAACVGPTCHVLDWFHLAMRIQHVAQALKDWPDITDEDRQDGARLADAVDHIRWRLWHGQVRRALDLIGDTLAALDAAAAAAGKVAGVLRALETYVVGQATMITDYATARHGEEPISTAPTESTVQSPLHRRMRANQQMRWSPRGALLQRTNPAVLGDVVSIVLNHAPFERAHAGILIREGRDLILDLRAHRIDLVTQALVLSGRISFYAFNLLR